VHGMRSCEKKRAKAKTRSRGPTQGVIVPKRPRDVTQTRPLKEEINNERKVITAPLHALQEAKGGKKKFPVPPS